MKISLRAPCCFAVNRRAGFTTPLRLLLATTAAFWIGAACAQTDAATGASTRRDTELRFQDFFRTPIGPAGLEITDTLREASGTVVRLVGYMVQQENAVAGRFMLATRPVQMSEHADGEADDLPPATVVVYLDPSQREWAVPHVRGLVALRGVLGVGRHEAVDGRVSWVRLQLDADAARSMNAFELALFQHQRLHPH